MLRLLDFLGGRREVAGERVLELMPGIPSWGAIALAEHPRPDAERLQLGRQPPRRETWTTCVVGPRCIFQIAKGSAQTVGGDMGPTPSVEHPTDTAEELGAYRLVLAAAR